MNRNRATTESILTAAPKDFSGTREVGLRQVVRRWSELLLGQIPEGYENESGFHLGETPAVALKSSARCPQNLRAV